MPQSDDGNAAPSVDEEMQAFHTRLGELMKDGRMSQGDAVYRIARENNEQQAKINIEKNEAARIQAWEAKYPDQVKAPDQAEEPEPTLTFAEDYVPHKGYYHDLKVDQAKASPSPIEEARERELRFAEDRPPGKYDELKRTLAEDQPSQAESSQSQASPGKGEGGGPRFFEDHNQSQDLNRGR